MEKAVTRTFHFNACECHIYDVSLDTGCVKEFLVPSRIKTEKKRIDYIKNQLSENFVFMRVLSTQEKEIVYAISEEDFMKHGVMINKKEN